MRASSDGTDASTLIEPFRETWAFTRTLTRSFIETTPADRWEFSPHPRYGSMARQFRHVVQVTDLYSDVLRRGRLTMDSKFARYDGSLDRDDLLAGLARSDDDLDSALTAAIAGGIESYEFGGEQMSLGVVLGVFIEHEANHHGLWSAYATLGGWETPDAWRANWDL